MSDIPKLNDLEEDLLKELFNLGVGKAAASLSKMVTQEILLSVPKVEFAKSSAMIELLDSNESIISISQSIHGPFDAKSILLFPEHGGMEVVRQMLGSQLSDEAIADLHEEALSEIGNVVLNACIGAISKSMNTIFDVEIPKFNQASPENLLQASNLLDGDTILLININMKLKDSDIEGYLAFVFSSESLKKLQGSLTQLINSLS